MISATSQTNNWNKQGLLLALALQCLHKQLEDACSRRQHGACYSLSRCEQVKNERRTRQFARRGYYQAMKRSFDIVLHRRLF
jgi:hypothetical protein